MPSWAGQVPAEPLGCGPLRRRHGGRRTRCASRLRHRKCANLHTGEAMAAQVVPHAGRLAWVALAAEIKFPASPISPVQLEAQLGQRNNQPSDPRSRSARLSPSPRFRRAPQLAADVVQRFSSCFQPSAVQMGLGAAGRRRRCLPPAARSTAPAACSAGQPAAAARPWQLPQVGASLLGLARPCASITF